MYKSRVNQPERVFLNSSDMNSVLTTPTFSQFQCTFDTPILGAKRTQLLRMTVPNCFPNIPDYQLTFWYHNLGTSATTRPSASTIRCIRLYPSSYVPPSGFTAYTKNRAVTDPNDLVTLLNTAANTGDSNTYNPYWNSGYEVTFAYDTTKKQITIAGQGTTIYITPAGWNDPFVLAAQPLVLTYNFNTTTSSQPYVPGYTLNLRLGYTMSGNALSQGGTNPLYACLTNTPLLSPAVITPDGYPNLVYTQCYYVYSNIVAGSSLGSGKQHNLLTVMPNNAAPLAVASYVAATINWLTKVPDNIHEIQISIFDDANQPLPFYDNAQINLELGFWYGEENKL